MTARIACARVLAVAVRHPFAMWFPLAEGPRELRHGHEPILRAVDIALSIT
jgi:hypothetical protein